MSRAGIRRNDPCHCKSGKKYKNCCLNPPSADFTPPEGQMAKDPLGYLRAMAQIRPGLLADYAYKAVPEILSRLELDQGAGPFVQLHRTQERCLRRHFQAHPVFCNVLRHFDEKLLARVEGPADLHDPVVSADAAVLFNVIHADYPLAFDPVVRIVATVTLRDLLRRVVVRAAAAVRDQVDCLCDAIVGLVRFLEGLNPEAAGRLVLVELPIGNSIPVRLAQHLLASRQRPCHLVRISLARNDSENRGLTRERILRAKLGAAGVTRGDTVVYLDEWLTGSNFFNVSRILARLCNGVGARLVPTALLSRRAAGNTRYLTSFVPAHDELCKPLGGDGARLRFPFPAVRTRHDPDRHFFWGEQDWMAGYRKMQTLGSAFSLFDDTIERLKASPDELGEAKIALLEYLVTSGKPDREVGPLILGFIGEGEHFREQFEQSRQEYLRLREEIKGRLQASQFCWGEEDLGRAAEEVMAVIKGVAGKSLAVICMMIAKCYFLHNLHAQLESVNLFYYKSHAPRLTELTGPRLALHEEWMAILKARVAEVSAGSKPGHEEGAVAAPGPQDAHQNHPS